MNKKRTWERIYNIVVCVLAIISVVLAIRDMTRGLDPIEIWTDRIIYALFVTDYVVRLILAKEKKTFFKCNIIDLIAILPFNSAFRALRLLKLTKALRVLKFLRFVAVAGRLLSRMKGIINTNGFKYVLILSGIAILGSSIAMTFLEGMDFLDALWWSFVTTTTVGYGDLSPASGGGRIVAVILMAVGIGLIGSLTSSITSFFIRDNQREPSSDRVDMVLTLYDSLSEEEKEAFKKQIK